jgi:hypothetical protein
MKGRWRDFRLTRSGYSEHGLVVIRLYNDVCVPHGFMPVNSFSEALHDALELFVEDGLDEAEELNVFRSMSEEAVALRDSGDRIYNTPRGAKLLRILWSNY